MGIFQLQLYSVLISEKYWEAKFKEMFVVLHLIKMHIGPNVFSLSTVYLALPASDKWNPVWVPRVRIDPLRLLAGCRKRRLNQAPVNFRGFI